MTQNFKRPPVFPSWCDTGKQDVKRNELRHQLEQDESIVWQLAGDSHLPHHDHIEMSGFHVSGIISYGVNEQGELMIHRHAVFPGLRTIPNDTRGSLSHNFEGDALPAILVNGQPILHEYPRRIRIKGILEIVSGTAEGLEISRTIFPAVHSKALIERITFSNTGTLASEIEVAVPSYEVITEASQGIDGAYSLKVTLVNALTKKELLEPGEERTFYCLYTAAHVHQLLAIDPAEEERTRLNLIGEWFQSLRLETPDRVLNTAFNYAKLRGSESIFQTHGGLMHGPGGGDYYAALWTNDQCEYINPFFPFLGYEAGIEQSINGYLLFMSYMDPQFQKALVSSIVAEGTDYWNGVGDRGDASMFAYGAARFCLANGDKQIAEQLWPGIEWSLEYSRRQRNEKGVICSDSDELENRFPSGDANLCTSCLVYDALISAALLVVELGKPRELAEQLRQEASELRSAIEAFFGANVEGYETYQYYQGNDVLRSWICAPFVVDIFDRKDETLKALFSPRLWTSNGLSTQAGDQTFWDRSTLYALRGVFAAGEPDLALKHLTYISKQRLLGEHVPYFVEAYPEGNQRHLSAESGLYARIYVEGLFGIRPTGFKSFTCNPQLPADWQVATLRSVKAFQSDFDLVVSREGKQKRLKVYEYGQLIFDQTAGDQEAFQVILSTGSMA
ncbi:glucosidase family protein [Paenibacillus alba]|uniref:Uncharacterized protein n=1 Tax=Paenibacillus alba TaxID=1197127 RepID=A0ABU6GCJ9_9BACL|nr:hypothetical protein [Paenibacillus alba]MEC0230424.1 hypothetical protein [Paenibacillus alba]